MQLAHLPDVVVGCEVSAHFPGHDVDVHLGVLDITPEQHTEIDRRRHDVAVLLPYLREQEIFTVINHVASQVNGRLTAALIASLLPWVDAFEVRNGSRLRAQNRTAEALAGATGKLWIGGSDSHTGRGIGKTCTIVDDAYTREAFMAGRRASRGRVEGRHGWYFTMASDLVRFAGRFYEEKALRVADQPLDWRPARRPARGHVRTADGHAYAGRGGRPLHGRGALQPVAPPRPGRASCDCPHCRRGPGRGRVKPSPTPSTGEPLTSARARTSR